MKLKDIENASHLPQSKVTYYHFAKTNQWYKVTWDSKKPWLISSFLKMEGLPPHK